LVSLPYLNDSADIMRGGTRHGGSDLPVADDLPEEGVPTAMPVRDHMWQ
jgi:hypothetical protein